MGGPGSGGSTKFSAQHDWPLLLAEYKADWEPLDKNMGQFAKAKGILPTTVYNAFKRLEKRSALISAHERNKPMLLKAQGVIRRALEAEDVDPKFALAVYEKTFEREEPNAGLAQQINITVPPMFASPVAMAAVKALTDPSEDVLTPVDRQAEALRTLTAPEGEEGL